MKKSQKSVKLCWRKDMSLPKCSLYYYTKRTWPKGMEETPPLLQGEIGECVLFTSRLCPMHNLALFKQACIYATDLIVSSHADSSSHGFFSSNQWRHHCKGLTLKVGRITAVRNIFYFNNSGKDLTLTHTWNKCWFISLRFFQTFNKNVSKLI